MGAATSVPPPHCLPSDYDPYSLRGAIRCESYGLWPSSHFLNPFVLYVFTQNFLLSLLVDAIWEVVEVIARGMNNNNAIGSYESQAGSMEYDFMLQGWWGIATAAVFVKVFAVPRLLPIYGVWKHKIGRPKRAKKEEEDENAPNTTRSLGLGMDVPDETQAFARFPENITISRTEQHQQQQQPAVDDDGTQIDIVQWNGCLNSVRTCFPIRLMCLPRENLTYSPRGSTCAWVTELAKQGAILVVLMVLSTIILNQGSDGSIDLWVKGLIVWAVRAVVLLVAGWFNYAEPMTWETWGAWIVIEAMVFGGGLTSETWVVFLVQGAVMAGLLAWSVVQEATGEGMMMGRWAKRTKKGRR